MLGISEYDQGKGVEVHQSYRNASGLFIRLALFAAAATLPLLVPTSAAAAPGEPSTPLANPDLERACGLDIHVILDESGSVGDSRADVQRAFRAFTAALKNTGSRLAVSEFSTVARLPLAGTAQSQYTVVTDATIASTFEPYIANGYRPDGRTHWEDAFRVARYRLPRPSHDQPHLVVFITDGNPNVIVKESKVTYDAGNPSVTDNEYENKVPLTDDETTQENEDPSADRAVSNANALKADGSHILAIAVGDGLSGSSTLNRLKKVSGPDVYDGTGTFDISTTDVYKEEDFGKLEEALRDAAFQLCSPSVTIRKLVDLTPDTGPEDAVSGAGFDLTATATPTPANWVLPPDGTGASATTATDGTGFANFQWDTFTPVTSTVTITEVDPSSVIPGLEYVPSATSCSYRTPDIADTPLSISPVPLGFTASIPDEAIVTCTILNRLPASPAIDIEKYTNGTDADAAPGPSIPIGAPVAWTYVVTNTGNVTLDSIAVADDRGLAVTCPVSTLAPEAQTTCTAAGVAAAGQYANTGTVTARNPSGGTVTDADPSHYFGTNPGIDVEKTTNGSDADQAPGPGVAAGSTVTWAYTVSNTGNTALTGVAVVDDLAGAVTCPSTTLAIGASMTCTPLTDTAVTGQYENLATATGTAGVVAVGDSDPSHYFGAAPAVSLVKLTNGRDANTPPGPLIDTGDPVAWMYEITNTGNVALSAPNVVDSDPAVAIACPRIGVLGPGHTMICRAGGTARTGQYANTATVTATDTMLSTVVTDADPSHYFGISRQITVEKATNGVDADQPPGPYVPIGAPVTWTYVVTNGGNVPLRGLVVTDLVEGAATCPQTTLATGASVTCTLTGTSTAEAYLNWVVATATDLSNIRVVDVDPSHYYGTDPGILLEKSTNGDDADVAPGPSIAVGDPVEWRYEVVNTGNATLSGITVTDSKGVVVACPQTTLAAGATMTCTGSGVATAGQYENIATARGTGPSGLVMTDTDPSHYFGISSAISLQKLTNGVDADTGTGPTIAAGATVTWTYIVSNTGNVEIRSFDVADSDPSVAVVCPETPAIPPGGSVTCRATGTAQLGQYSNIGTVTALDVYETPLTATDPSHYIAGAATLPDTGSDSFPVVALTLLLAGVALVVVAAIGRSTTD